MSQGRGRPRLNPTLRFPDIIQYFNSVEQQGTPYRIYLPTKNHAVVLMHKMNRCRKAIRDMSTEGITTYDAWVFRVIENVVEVDDKTYYTPFNTRVEVGGRDITKKLQETWRPINYFGIPIEPGSSMYAYEYKRQFGVDPPSDVEPTTEKSPPANEERENNIDPDKPLGLFEEDEEHE
jgi:hypothetical protein